MKPDLHFFQKLLLLLFIPMFSGQLVLAQENNFQAVDDFAKTFKKSYNNVASLATQLTEPFASKLEKHRALFIWIAENVRYDCKKFHNPKRVHISAHSPEELERKKQEWRKKEVEKTAKYKRGVCEDYSRLYKAMCDAIGLEAVVVSGDARDFHKPYRNAHDNPHAWNAIKIDGQWHLLDATWAAGHVNPQVTKFTRRLSSGHFMTKPDWFAQTHFPDDPKWQLLDHPLGKKEFPGQPMINIGQMDYPVQDFSLQVKEIKKGKYDREVRIKMKKAPPFYLLSSGRSKPIKFEHKTQDDWQVFHFSSRGARDLIIFGGESQRSRMGWLARYDL